MVILPHRRKAFKTESGSGGDPYFASVVLLLHCDGSDGSTTFIDSSSYARAMSVSGDAKISTTDPKFGTGAMLLDGIGDDVYAADSPDWDLGTADFTLEGWVYPTSATAAQTILAQWITGGTAFFFGVGPGYGLYLNNTLVIGYTAWPSANNWHHWAVSRNTSSIRLFINGTQHGSTYNIGSSAITTSSTALRIGRDGYGNPYFSGKMDEIRITKGVGRYAANFTPPTAAFPDSIPSGGDPFGTNVALLLHCDGANGSTTFTDSSPYPKTVTASGNAQVTTTNPKFGTGAMLLDGSFDFATVPSSIDFDFGIGDFTIEFWLNWSSLVGFQTVLERNYISAGGFAIQSGNGTGRLIFYLSGAVIAQESTSAVINTWYFYAITRKGTTVTIYRDGVQLGSGTSAVNITSSAILGIGGRSANGLNCFNGRIDELRITAGISRYNANFIPPTAAFPDPGTIFTSYSNPGGSGNRTATIPVSKSAGADIRGALSRFVGVGASGTYFANVPNGEWLKFDFGTAKVITELKYYQEYDFTQGTWQLEGSNDNSTWTAIGNPFEIIGTTFVSGSAFSSNTNYYRYYRIKKTAGTVNSRPWAYQFDFKISL
jgi:hypothetical protein